jgi:hypothetical protein
VKALLAAEALRFPCSGRMTLPVEVRTRIGREVLYLRNASITCECHRCPHRKKGARGRVEEVKATKAARSHETRSHCGSRKPGAVQLNNSFLYYPAFFLVVQSSTGTLPEAVWTKIGPFLSR